MSCVAIFSWHCLSLSPFSPLQNPEISEPLFLLHFRRVSREILSKIKKEAKNVGVGTLRRGGEHHTADGAERGGIGGADSESGEPGANAQEELPRIRAAREADRESAGAAPDFGAQEVPGDAGAAGAAGGRAAAGVSAGQQLPGAELPLPDGDGLEHRLPI